MNKTHLIDLIFSPLCLWYQANRFRQYPNTWGLEEVRATWRLEQQQSPLVPENEFVCFVVFCTLCSPFPLLDEEVWWRTRMLHTCPEDNNSFWSADGAERMPGEKYLERNVEFYFLGLWQHFLKAGGLWMWNGYYRKLSIMQALLLLNCMIIIKERQLTLKTSVACASMNPFWCLVSPFTRCQVLK